MLVCQCPLSYSEHIVSLLSFKFPTCKIQHNYYQCKHKIIVMAWLRSSMLWSTWISASKKAKYYYLRRNISRHLKFHSNGREKKNPLKNKKASDSPFNAAHLVFLLSKTLAHANTTISACFRCSTRCWFYTDPP